MSDTHILTDKETKAIADAISVIKKFGKYIERVNTTNWRLQDNLDKAIKAGDVTNEQKVNLRIYERAENLGRKLKANIRSKCNPKCECSKQKQENCEIARAYWIADLLCGVANGDSFGWEEAFHRLLHEVNREGYLNLIRNGRTSHCCEEGAEIKL